MSRLWTPPTREHRPKVSREHREGSAAHREQVLSMVHETTITPHWDRELQKIDRLLILRKAKEHAETPGVQPGFYHLIRLNEQGPLWIQVLEFQGRYVEPSSAMLEALRMCDLQNDAVVRARFAADELAAKRKERAQGNEREERLDEAAERVAAMTRTQILTSPDVAWAQNSAGRGRPTRGRGR